VWKNIAKIPWGKTISYAELARAVKKPKGYRAVANACGKNPVTLIIPCHRGIASDGTLGGFSSGIGPKKTLLAIQPPEPPVTKQKVTEQSLQPLNISNKLLHQSRDRY
jgi:methylated-DNA-[protein]-cysteine S-methyltransferase